MDVEPFEGGRRRDALAPLSNGSADLDPDAAPDAPADGWLSEGATVEYRLGPGLPPGWTAAMAAAGAGAMATTRLERVRTQRVPPRLRMDLRLGSAARVHVLSRIRLLAGEPVACSVSYVVASLAPALTERLAGDGSLAHALRAVYGLSPVQAWVHVGFGPPPPDVPGRLGMRRRPSLLWIRSAIDAGRGGIPVALSVTWLRPDRFHVRVGFPRQPLAAAPPPFAGPGPRSGAGR